MPRHPLAARSIRSLGLSPCVSLGLVLCAAPLVVAAQQPAPAAAAQPHDSTVTFQNGQLTVRANNASLRHILREIAYSTGMKISGAIPDGPVFGTYGPADPQHVMSTLLDGTETNILIVSNLADKPLQLRLTPRLGGPTPPNPNASAEQADQSDEPNQPPPGQPGALGQRPLRASAPPSPAPPSPSPNPAASNTPSEVSQPVVFPSISPTSASATGTTTPADPDNDQDTGTENVKTPQQIFEQLQQMQQTSSGSGNATNPPQQH